MKTKDILLVGVGLVAAYFVYKKYGKNKDGDKSQVLNNGNVETVVDPKKVTACEEKWTVFASTMKPASAAAYKAQKEAFIAECLTPKVKA
jgi:hypothetical protein